MSRRVVISALVLAASLGLVGCSAGGAADEDAIANGSAGSGSSDTGAQGDAPASSSNSADVVAAITQADAEMKLGFDFAALDAAAEWTAATYMAQSDGTRYMSLQAEPDQLDGIVAWIDAQNWDGWLIQDTDPGAEAMGKFRFLNDSSFTLQEIVGEGMHSVDVQFFDAE